MRRYRWKPPLNDIRTDANENSNNTNKERITVNSYLVCILSTWNDRIFIIINIKILNTRIIHLILDILYIRFICENLFAIYDIFFFFVLSTYVWTVKFMELLRWLLYVSYARESRRKTEKRKFCVLNLDT